MVNIFVIGRLGADAETVEWKNGKFIQLRLAVDDWNGAKITTWFRVTCDYDEKTLEFYKKGRLVSVSGTESVSLYTAKDGSTQLSRDIRAKSIELIRTGNGEHTANTVTTGTLKKDEPAVAISHVEVVETNTSDDLPF